MQLPIPISDSFWEGCLKGVSDVKVCAKTCYNNLADPDALNSVISHGAGASIRAFAGSGMQIFDIN